MRRIAIVSKNKSLCALARRKVADYGFLYDVKRPDVVITCGGDGTLLHAERLYPGVSKLPLKQSPTCRKCHDHSLEHALGMLQQGQYCQEAHFKLETVVRQKGKRPVRLCSLNDVIVRNKHLEHAIRFSVGIDGKKTKEMHIGDGVVVATPFGSTAYYHSITKRTFKRGVGIAYNNVMLHASPRLFSEDVVITITVLRGPAQLAADNDRYLGVLGAGDSLVIRRASTSALLLSLK